MKKRFSEEQIIDILTEAEAGLKPAELCRKQGISEAMYSNRKARKPNVKQSGYGWLSALSVSPGLAGWLEFRGR